MTAGGVLCDESKGLRLKQQHPEKHEQMQLAFDPPVVPDRPDHGWRKRGGFGWDSRGRKFEWHQPVTIRWGQRLQNEFALWVVQAMPDRCRKESCLAFSFPGYNHYHCYTCRNLIWYGELHGGSEIHVCLDCLMPRKWGRQEYPEYAY